MASFRDRRLRLFRQHEPGRKRPRRRIVIQIVRPEPRKPSGGGRALAFVARALFGLLVLVTLLTLTGAVGAYTAYSQLSSSLESRLDVIGKHNSFQTTRIYDRNGTLLYEFFGAGKRTTIPIDQISPLLINATVAIEDKTFFTNTGVDYEGILKALGRSLEAGEETGGASTITQQLIKQVVLTEDEQARENRYQRKVTEIILADELTKRYDKRRIMELYLNEIYYGNLAYGIEAASEVYFNTHARDLTLAQASLLAGLPQLPSYYEPINYLEGNILKGVRLPKTWIEGDAGLPSDITPPKWRQIAVLRQMVEEGYTTETEARRVAEADLPFTDQEVPLNAPHFVFYVRRLLEEQYGQQFANQGLSVYTSIDLNLQQMVQQQAADRIGELEERNIHNASVVVMQPNTGEILAMVGSIDYNRVVPSSTPGQPGNVLDGQVNVATRERQPGSALKPFTYLAAMERGMTPATVLWDVPTEFLGGTDVYAPLNYNGRWNGPVRMRTALANSLNMPAVKALKYAGINHTLGLLHRVGITGLQRGEAVYGLSLTLGGGEVTPLDLTTAYNTLASGGYYFPPVAIRRIVNGSGEVLQEFHPPPRIPVADPVNAQLPPRPGQQVLDPDLVAIITDMMSDDQARQPIWGLNSKLRLSRPAAVKTGTSNDWRDAWAAGFTPYATVAVWTGNNNNEPTARVESLTGGGVIWNSVMETMFADPAFSKILAEPYNGNLPIEFAKPPNLVRRGICRLSGPFNAYGEEWFTPAMLDRNRPTPTPLSPGATPLPSTRLQDGCNLYDRVTVARLDPLFTSTGGGQQEQPASLNQYCLPVDGVYVPEELLTTITLINLPRTDPLERVRYTGVSGIPATRDQIPVCSEGMIASVVPPGAVRMPDLRRFGENQAKEQLAALGLFNVYVDYQDRSRIPDVYDQFVPYAVVSTMPVGGEWVQPGTLVVLGIRAPEPTAPETNQAPVDQPASGPPPEQPTSGPPPEGQPTPPPADQPPPEALPLPPPEGQPTSPEIVLPITPPEQQPVVPTAVP